MKTLMNVLNTTKDYENEMLDEESMDEESCDSLMNYCPKCGRAHAVGESKYCLYCGAIVEEEETFKENLSIYEKVDEYIHGNHEYMNDIYKEGYKTAKLAAIYLVHDNDTAEDFASETMIKFFERGDLQVAEAFYGYIRIIAKRLVFDQFKNVRYKRTKSLDGMCYDKDNNLIYELKDVKASYLLEEKMISEVNNEYVRSVLNSLKKEERDVLIMQYHYAMSIQEMAEALQIKESTVIGRSQQGRLHFKQAISAIEKEIGVNIY